MNEIFRGATLKRNTATEGTIVLTRNSQEYLRLMVWLKALTLIYACSHCPAQNYNGGPCSGISPDFFNAHIKLPETSKDLPVTNCEAPLGVLSTLPPESSITFPSDSLI